MPTNTVNINPAQPGDFARLPFGELLQRLQANGFIVDAADYTEFAAIFDQLQPTNTNELKYYLAPVICRNEDEQKKFYQVFDTFIEEKPLFSQLNGWQKWMVRMRGVPRWWWLLPLVAVLITGVLLLFPPGRYASSLPAICFQNELEAKRTNLFSSYCDAAKQDTAAWTAHWDFGDSTAPVTGIQVQHTFAKHGQYRVRLVTNGSNNTTTTIDTLVSVCPERAEITDPAIGDQRFYPGDSLPFTVTKKDPSIALSACYWTVINVNTNETDTLRYNTEGHLSHYLARAPGLYTARLWYPGGCNAGSMRFIVEEPKQYALSVTSNGAPFPVTTRVGIWYIILLPSIAIAALLIARYLRRKKTPASPFQIKIDTTEYEGMEPPFEISYLPKDNQVQPLLDISKVSYNLSRRTEAELPELNVPGTIHQSIRNFGYVSPVYRNRQRPREYLLLIDDSNVHNQQTCLFSYLVKTFVKENVLIDLYTYHHTPGKFYKANQPTPVNFARLRDCNYYASLIIISKGYELLDNSTGAIKAEYRADLEWWEKRVLVTPVPAKDWSVSEQTLAAFFHLVPADMSGWISLAQFITEDAVLYRFTDEAWQTYKVKFADTVNTKGLRDYLGDEDLFQWLCATAIHHHIRWEILIQLGYAVLSNRNKTYKLNYTNLLKLARISWMEEGKFPAATRLALLKELSIENELIARKAMLELLKESDGGISMASFSYEEKQIQKHTDGFLLYANNASTNSMYAEDANRFMALWDDNKIMDNPLRIYLQPENNGWTTPLRSIKDNNKPIGIQEYINEHKEEAEKNTATIKKLYKRWADACLLLAAACMFALFGLFIFKDWMVKQKLNNWFGFVRTSLVSPTDISISIPGETCFQQFVKGADSMTISFDPQLGTGRTQWMTTKYFTDNIPFKDNLISPYEFKFRNVNISQLAGREVKITVEGNGNNRAISTTFTLNSAAYTLSLTGPGCGLDTIDLYYEPGNKEDYKTIEAQLQKNLPRVHFHFNNDNQHYPLTANYISFGSQVDSAEKFEIAMQAKKAGITIKEVRNGSFTNDSIKNTNRMVLISGFTLNQDDPELSDDSLRCLLLGQCKTTTAARPMVYIQYDQQAAPDSMELFRRSLVTAGWKAPGIERKTFNYASAVRYFNPAQKTYADTIALLAARFFNQPIKSQFVQTAGTPVKPLELWFKPDCETVSYSDVYKNLQVPYIFQRDPTAQFIFKTDQVLAFDGGTEDARTPGKKIRKCGNTYTMYATDLRQLIKPTTDTLIFSFDKKNITVQNPKSDKTKEKGTVVFDFTSYSNSNTVFPADKGDWQYSNKPADKVSFSDNNITMNGSLIGNITAVMNDNAGCRLYSLQDRSGVAGIIIVYDGFNGKYISTLLTADVSVRQDIRSNLINAWGNGVIFTKMVKAAPTAQASNAAPTTQAAQTAQKKILWVDDNEKNNEKEIDSLRRMGFTIETIANAKNAINKISLNKYDLVISDISESGDSIAGLTLLQAIRSVHLDTPVFFYTSAASAKKYQQQAIKEGAMGVYSDPGSLFANVRGYLVPSKARY